MARRCAIELHFRWIKQALKIARFFGKSENAARTKVFIALIVFMLLRLAQAAAQHSLTLLDFGRLARAQLMSRWDTAALGRPVEQLPADNRQHCLD
jgi:IS4 transposase